MYAKTLFNMSYGMYIIGAKDGTRNAGCVVTSISQATANPITLTVSINKENFTNACVKKTKEFTISVLSESAKESTIKAFGFSSSRDRDKFKEVPSGLSASGLPYVNEGVSCYIQCKVIDTADYFSHTIFIAEVLEANKLLDEPPMSYKYYHEVIKGKTPPKASIDVPERKKGRSGDSEVYVCGVCGYEHTGGKNEFERIADVFQCPVCGAQKHKFNLR
jgi:flavin reductase (DIM6/NTAB) family NADH-FMN oxidoreductase RutF/rubredoxin